MSATAMASELGDRLKQEGDKLRKLELVGHAAQMVHKNEKKKNKAKGKKRSKLGTLTMFAVVGGIVYGVYRMLRDNSTVDTFANDTARESNTGPTADNRVRATA